MVKRSKVIGLRIAMAIVALNIWTGSPLLALWIGSRFQPAGGPQMGPIFVVVLVLALLSFMLGLLLSFLGQAHDRLTGNTATVHRQGPWLRSMRGERPQYPGEHAHLTGLERTLVAIVVLAAAAFEVWFFFFSGSPIG